MANTKLVFVYGTLRPPRPDTTPEDTRYYSTIAKHIKSAEPATLAGARLYDLGSYPGAVPGQDTIRGDLLTVRPRALSMMDQIEGHPNFFKRKKVTVQTEERSVKAWVYWAPKALTLGRTCILSGDWLQRTDSAGESCSDEAPDDNAGPVDATLQKLVARFAAAECSWLTSVRPEQRAHSVPVWHVWHRGRAYVITTANSVKINNISTNPNVVIAHQDPLNPVIIEGWGTVAPAMRPQLQPLFKAKYDWDINTDSEYDTIIEVTPLKLMAWGKYGEGRWRSEEILRVKLADA